MFPVNRKPNRNLVSKRFGEANEFVGDLYDSLGDLFVVDASTLESMGCGKREPGNNSTTTIENKTACVRQHLQNTPFTSGRPKRAKPHAFPHTARQLH